MVHLTLTLLRELVAFALIFQYFPVSCVRTHHITHGQPVVRRVLLPGGVQDSTGTAFAREARTRQGADVQLPADIQPDNHLEGDRTAGARQAAATPALIFELLTTAVSVPARALH